MAKSPSLVKELIFLRGSTSHAAFLFVIFTCGLVALFLLPACVFFEPTVVCKSRHNPCPPAPESTLFAIIRSLSLTMQLDVPEPNLRQNISPFHALIRGLADCITNDLCHTRHISANCGKRRAYESTVSSTSRHCSPEIDLLSSR